MVAALFQHSAYARPKFQSIETPVELLHGQMVEVSGLHFAVSAFVPRMIFMQINEVIT